MSAAARVAQPSSRALVTRPAFPPSPGFVRESGALLWDVGGRSYLDFDNRDGAVILGHADPEVAAAEPNSTDAVAVTACLNAWAPCAEEVRLTTDIAAAMAAAMAIARAETGRGRILACTGRAVRGATQSIEPHRLGVLDGFLDVFGDETAAVILEPFAFDGLTHADLARLQALAAAHGALLIFDETRSGLRQAMGGAQTVFGITPDLAVFGPSLGNGAPIAALAGRRDLMARCVLAEPDPWATAAAAATLRKLQSQPVIATLGIRGAELLAELETLLTQSGADAFIALGGDTSWSRLDFAGPRQAAQFRAEALAHGVVAQGAHIMSYAHGDAAISGLVAAYREILPRLVRSCGQQAAS